MEVYPSALNLPPRCMEVYGVYGGVWGVWRCMGVYGGVWGVWGCMEVNRKHTYSERHLVHECIPVGDTHGLATDFASCLIISHL